MHDFEAISKVRDETEACSKLHFGTYIGDGEENHVISLDFAPKILMTEAFWPLIPERVLLRRNLWTGISLLGQFRKHCYTDC